MSHPEHLIEIQRTINAGADDIYAAWTLLSLLNRWMTNHAENELRVGGAYRYELAGAEGQTIVHRGEFLALEPGVLLRQTFSVEDGKENPFSREFIELRLKAISSGRTEVRFANGWDGPGLDEESHAAVRGDVGSLAGPIQRWPTVGFLPRAANDSSASYPHGAVTVVSFRQAGPDIAEELSQVVPGAESGSEGGWRAMFDSLEKVLPLDGESRV